MKILIKSLKTLLGRTETDPHPRASEMALYKYLGHVQVRMTDLKEAIKAGATHIVYCEHDGSFFLVGGAGREQACANLMAALVEHDREKS